MIIHTDFHGEVEYDEEYLVVFPDGFFGFPELKKYLPLCLNDDDDSLILMQSVEQPEVAFVVVNPVFLDSGYAPALSPEELACLGTEDSGELSYYAICVLRDNYQDSTVNLKCPLVINPQTRIGMQIILEHSSFGYRHKISSFPGFSNPDNL